MRVVFFSSQHFIHWWDDLLVSKGTPFTESIFPAAVRDGQTPWVTFAFRCHFKKPEGRAHSERSRKEPEGPPKTAAQALFGDQGSGVIIGGDSPYRFSFHRKGKLFFLKTEL